MKKQIAKLTAQQGDIILKKLEALPDGTKLISRKRCILAEGEATGHAHIVDCDEAELLRDGDRILLRLTKAASITHEEHKPITLSPGVWEVGRVQEYDYYSQVVHPVAD